MKRLLVILLLSFMGTGAVLAQNSVVGKWKIARINVEGMDLDLENPTSIKKAITDQMSQAGQTPDSATVDMMYNMLTSTFDALRLEFTSDGKGIYSMPDPSGEAKTDTASYTVDYEKGIVHTVSIEEGTEKKEQLNIRFEGDYMVVTKPEKMGEIIHLKRVSK